MKAFVSSGNSSDLSRICWVVCEDEPERSLPLLYNDGYPKSTALNTVLQGHPPLRLSQFKKLFKFKPHCVKHRVLKLC